MLIETDIGHDPDDALALTYLIYNNIPIEAILIFPGFIGQCCIVKEIYNHLNKTPPPILSDTTPNENKFVLSKFHKNIVKNTNYEYDGKSVDYLKNNKINGDIFIIGPPKGLVNNIIENNNYFTNKVFYQGGYISYEDIENYGVCIHYKKHDFIGVKMVQSYNVSAISKHFNRFTQSCAPNNLHWITKSLNHTVMYEGQPSKYPYLEFLLSKIDKGKKLHDIVAAYCYCNQDKVQIVKGEMKIIGQKNYVDIFSQIEQNIIVDIDRPNFWMSL